MFPRARSTFLTGAAAIAATLCVSDSAYADVIQITDLRLDATAAADEFPIDPSFGPVNTRSTGAAFEAAAELTIVNQAVGNTNTANLVKVQTTADILRVERLNRFGTVRDGGGSTSSGGVEWSVDLSELSTYLANNNLQLDAIDLNLDVINEDGRWIDVYLSYDGTGIDLTGLSTTDLAGNYTTFVEAAGTGTVDTIVNNDFLLLEQTLSTDFTESYSLLSQVNAGATEFNIIIASGDFWSGNGGGDFISILEGSGITIDTSPIPEPGSMGLTVLGAILLIGRKRREA